MAVQETSNLLMRVRFPSLAPLLGSSMVERAAVNRHAYRFESYPSSQASLAELVYAHGLGPCPSRDKSSTLLGRTKYGCKILLT